MTVSHAVLEFGPPVVCAQGMAPHYSVDRGGKEPSGTKGFQAAESSAGAWTATCLQCDQAGNWSVFNRAQNARRHFIDIHGALHLSAASDGILQAVLHDWHLVKQVHR